MIPLRGSHFGTLESTIHNNTQLLAIDKFNYLHPLLKKSALQDVAGLKITAANYVEAVAIPKKSLGTNKRSLISIWRHCYTWRQYRRTILEIFMSLLTKWSPTLEDYVHLMFPHRTLLSSIFMSKLPQDVRLVISRQEEDDKGQNFDKLLERVGEEVKAWERVGSMTHQHSTTRSTTRERPPAGLVLHTGGTVLSSTYCGQGHPSETCNSVSDIETLENSV